MAALPSGGNSDGQRTDRAQHVGVSPDGLTHHLDHRPIPLQDFLPQDGQLHLGQTVSNATMYAEAEGKMLARPGTIDDEAVWVFDRVFVAVARYVPHGDLVALADRLACNFR